MAKSKFTYQKRTYDEAKKQINESDSGIRDGFLSANLQLFKPSEGTTKIRILPPGWPDADHYGYRIHVHYSIGPNNDAYICPYYTVNPETGESKKRCPMCDERNRVMDSDETYAKKLKPNSRVLLFLLERGGKNTKPVLKAWAMPASLDKAILQQSIDDETMEVLPIDCPQDGYDLDIIRDGVGITTKYSIKVARRSTEVDDFDEDIWPLISDKNSIPSNLIFYDYEYLNTVFNGGGTTKEASKPTKDKKKINLEALTIDDLIEMEEAKLLEVIEAMGSDIDPSDYQTLEDLAEDIADELKAMFKKKPKKDPKPKAEPKEEPEEEPEEEEPEEEKEKKPMAKRPLKPKEPIPEEETLEPEEEPEEEEEKKIPSSNQSRLANLRNRNKDK